MKQLRLLLVAVFFAVSAGMVFAQVPGNDVFANRYVISGTSISTNGTTVGAGNREAGEPAVYFNQSQQTVWYEWTPTLPGSTTISISGSYRETITLCTGTAVGSLSVPNAASPGNGGTNTSFSFTPTVGTSYKIQVGGRNGATGTFTLSVNQTVSGPAATVTAPTGGQIFTNPANITLTATASSGLGTITNVSFFYGGSTLIGSDTNSPFSIVWSNMADGNYTITARATDTTGASGTSGGVSITVRPFGYFSAQLCGSNTLWGTNSYWKYKDDGSDQGTAWIAPAFDDSAWLAGPAEIGYGEFAARGATTNVSYGPDPNNKYITTYFRNSFTVTNAANLTNLLARYERDDGVVLYLNGVEVLRDNMPGGAPTYLTTASANANDDGTTLFAANLNPSLLVNGLNVLAAEIHQDTNTSSDITWYLELTASGAGTPNLAPTVAITNPVNSATFVAPASISINANANDADGTVTNVAFYQNGSLIGSVTNAPYTLTFSNVAVGLYALTAVATDNLGASTTSTGINVTVTSFGTAVWTAFNDHYAGAGTHANATAWNVLTNLGGAPGASGLLKNITSGANLPVTLSITNVGIIFAPTSGTPNPGTPAYNLFNTYIDFGNGTLNHAIQIPNSASAAVGHVFTGLDPSKRYRFSGTSVRGGPYPDRWTTFELMDALGFTTAHTAGCLTNGTPGATLAANQAALNSGSNNIAGDLVVWDNIQPSVGGSFTILARQYTGGGAPGGSTAGPYGYALMAEKLEEFSLSAVINVALTAPGNGASFAAPSDIALAATASAGNGVTNVGFYAGTNKIGDDVSSPYGLTWSSVPAGSYALTAVASDSTGARATSSIVNVTVTNSSAPVVVSQVPAAGSTVSSLTSVQVTFNKTVAGVDASDFLVNGTPASSFSGSGASYTFNFTQPTFGTVFITWASGHGIADLSAQPFNTNSAGANWSYNLADTTAPIITARNPVAGATVTNLSSINVNFSETVVNVDPGDMLINGSPAIGLSGSGSNYTFSFAQPLPGTVNITWASGHGITDVAANAFNGAAASWAYNFQITPTVLISSNSVWRFVKGSTTTNVTTPQSLWRTNAYDDSWWTDAPLPIFYGDTGYTNATTPGTYVGDMLNGYLSVYVRKTFVLNTPSAVSNFIFRVQVDDGFVIWINGVEATRLYVTPVDPVFNTPASTTVSEPSNNGGGYSNYTASGAALLAALVPGTNVIAIQGFNQTATSSDFGLNVQVEATIFQSGAPLLASVTPTAGPVLALTNITVLFSEAVSGVNASDLLINGVAATNVTGGTSNALYVFSFPQPAFGLVNVTWAAAHGIQDFDAVPKPFDATAPGATFSYSLLNPNAPVVATQTPVAGATVSVLNQINIVFSKNVSGVDATDLRLNGAVATGLSGSGSNYTFTFPQPAYGSVAITWTTNHGIFATGSPADTFDGTRPGSTWSYTLVDQIAPVVAAKNPAAGANVTNLTSLTVTFSENVTGVNASDLLINGVAATGFSGSGSNYTFTFVQPNSSVITVTWTASHGIADTAGNPFDASGGGASWQYFTPDTLPPVVSDISPLPSITVRDLTKVVVTFSEPVTGVNASDLLVNNVPATSVSGSSAGPYTFFFTQPAAGTVEIIWAAGHGITDLATVPNNFAGGAWTYLLNPNAVFADKVVVNEIMFQPPSKSTNDEWIEFKNTDTVPINLNGWRITKGVDYTFPNVTIPAGGFLVVPANTNSFHAKYPAVTNYVGPWTGDLANHDGDIRLETPLGEIVNELHYASEGDWAVRIRGPLSVNHRGWTWRSPAGDASGPALELMNSALPNSSGQNWRSSIATNGTPGAANSAARTNIPPMILDLAHFPVLPRSTDPVVITAKLVDERTNGLTVSLFYRSAHVTNVLAFTNLTMFDDGAHNDGVAGDKVYAATIPALASETVVEFYVQAVDLDGNTNTWPAAARDEFNVAAQYANALYQVDDTVYAFPQPLYKLILTETERRERKVIETPDSGSNAEMNGSLITVDGTGTEIRYNISIRERGAGSRGRVPANQRVNVPDDRRWKGVREFNLNTQYTESQYAGYLLSRKAGLDSEYARIVRVTINNTNNANAGSPQFGCYIHVEAPDSDLASAHFPQDSGGNVYRISSGAHAATLAAHLPPTSVTYSNLGYNKVSNTSLDDWSDITNLTYVLNVVGDSNYEAAVRATVNVEQWMLYFAVNALLSNEETAIGSGTGDDSGLYHAPRENRWYFIAHDWDTVLNEGDTILNDPTRTIFRAGVGISGNSSFPGLASINRFLTWSNFTPIYYNTLRRLCQTTFAPAELGRTLDEGLSSFASTAAINQMKTFASNRVNYVLSVLPSTNIVAASSVGGTLTTNTVFSVANSPYTITSSLTVPSGVTLVIQPGVTVQVAASATITVTGTGVLFAKGTPTNHIHFTKSSASNWGSLDFINAPNESRIEYADFDSCAGTTIGGHAAEIHVNGGSKVFFNFLNFANVPAQEYISFDGSTFIVQNSTFPTYPWATSAPEMLHGINGINAGGYGIFRSNYFGHTFGFNDTIDFTGGQRPGPILQFIGNIFDGAGDDNLDLDSTDAWIEGNIFMHVHRDPNRTDQADDTGSAISGGVDVDGQFSEWTVINNLFYDVDHVFLNKGGTGTGAGRVIFVNNTVAHVNKESGGGPSTNIAAFIFTDDQVAYPNPSYGAGAYIAGNIIWDCPKLVDNYNTNNHTIIFESNILAQSWSGLGSNNVVTDPLLNLQLITTITNATAAQVRAAFVPKTNSPALGTGFGGLDKGGMNPKGLLFISGPTGNTTNASASLRLFPGGVFHWGTVAPNYDWGYTRYKWKLDNGPWSAELAISNSPAINLSGLPNGAHTVYVTGKNDAGYYQDDTYVYPADGVVPAHLTASHTWTINSPGSGIRINEVLASNQNAVNHEGTHPDLIELQNVTDAAIDLGGVRLTDDQSNPDKFIFDPGTVIPAGGYLVVYANNDDGTTGIHVGFSLSKDGQSLYLYDTVDRGGILIDSVTFGLQVTDFSVGRVGAVWTLCVPTAGLANVAAVTGDPTKLIINEILAAELAAFPDDFVEIYNSQSLPVAMGGLFFTDNPPHWPDRSPVPALTFISSNAYIAFRADGHPGQGADHLDFSLSADRGIVALLNTDYSVISCVIYGPQTTDISQGRIASNLYDNNAFTTPTPGAPNLSLQSTNFGVVLNEVLAANSTVRELDGSTPDWIELYNVGATNVDLGDYSLSDSSLTPRKYVFTNGTIITAGGYLRLRCDGGQPATTTNAAFNNTGFNIKAEGGSVYLFDKLASGGGLLNAVTYGLQAVDFSIGRVPNGTGAWALTVPTPGGASILASTASAGLIKINEWMAAPSSGDDWFELWNPSPAPVAIGGYYTTDDLNNRTKSPIPALSYLGASTNGYQRFWADSTPSAGANHANFKFSNAGESIGFANPSGTLIDSITFPAQQTGVSEGRFPDGTATIVRFPGTESPGDPNYLLITNVVINEALTHTDPPLEDAIELRNLTASPIDLSNWWLSDAKGTPRKYRITNGVVIPANGFVVFYEYQFNSDPTNNRNAFSLSSSKGDQIYLSTGDAGGNLTGYRTSVDFGAAQNGVSFGRYVTSDTNVEFVAMSARSLGQDDPGNITVFRTGTGLANPYPKVGPVVISKIMYHPPDVGTNDNTLDEFIELKNITLAAVPLYDPLAATNTWRLRDAVDFDFPTNVSLGATGSLLLVTFDPVNNPGQLAIFRGKYSVPGNLPVYGPYTGKLANNDDRVELYRPDNPDAGFVPYVLADRAHYYDLAPWPPAADGTGQGLQRVSLTGYGNDPTNWVALALSFGGVSDTDGDGMPDAWELLYGLNPNNPADAGLDPDGDGATNLQEYLAGTNPNNATSVLKITSVIDLGANNVRLIFTAVSNRTYVVEYKKFLIDTSWTGLTNIGSAPSNRTLNINSLVPTTNRFFRVHTP